MSGRQLLVGGGGADKETGYRELDSYSLQPAGTKKRGYRIMPQDVFNQEILL